MQPYPTVRLNSPKRFNHPWIFQKLIAKDVEKPRNGSVVDIYDSEEQWVGRGLYNGHARVALRVLTENQHEMIDQEFFYQRFRSALSLRQKMLKLDEVTDAYRLVHSEGDLLSGLVIDKFRDLLVIEYFSSGMYRLRPQIEQALTDLLPGSRFYGFAEEHVQKQESIDIRSPAPPEPLTITEHQLKFKVTPGSKHKTGFFVDQRDNRKFLSTLVQGGTVLDICCNSGGFSVYAKALGGASEVTGLDLDLEAIKLAEENARLNQVKLKFVQVDLFHWLREAIASNLKFDTVILDPAKQTRTKEDVPTALKRYSDMNRLAMQVVKPGGILLSCSCSGLVGEAEYVDSIRRAAFHAGKQAQVFRLSGAAGDHPFSVHAQESRYLKAVWCRIS